MSEGIKSAVISPTGSGGGAVAGTSVTSLGVSSGEVLSANGDGTSSWEVVSGTGTVTSAGVVTDSTTDNIFVQTSHVITGSPITGSGNMTLSLATQTAKYALMGPTSGSAAAPTFRAIAAADIPTLNQNTSGSAASLSATLAIASGGTNATTASAALSNLGGAPTASPAFTTQVTFGSYHLEPSESALTASGSTLAVDLSTASAFAITLGHSTTVTFSNGVAGGTYVCRIIQGASAYTCAFNSSKYPGGTAPTISTASGAIDIITFYYDGTSYYGTFAQAYA